MYEIHLTIAPVSRAAWPALERHAAAIGARAMLIELARGAAPVQPMLTLTRAGRREEVIRFAAMLARQSARAAYPVLRCKIEQDAATPDTGSHHYFEWHGRLDVTPAMRVPLAALCQQFGGHLSNNALRGGASRYVTVREARCCASLRERVAALLVVLGGQGWTVDKQQWEKVIHDSNLALDAGWLEAQA